MNDIKSAKRNKLQDPLFALMLIAMYGANFRFDYNKLAVQMVSTWTYDD